MDLEGLIWIAIAAIYFLMRGLGGKKRRPTPAPPRKAPSRPEPQRAQPQRAQPGQNSELDQALREIRQALGFPGPEEPATESRREETPQRVEQPLPSRETQLSEERRAPMRRADRRGDEQRVERPLGRSGRLERPLDKTGRVERPLPPARGEARPVEKPLSEPRFGKSPLAESSRKPASKRPLRGADRPDHRLESSYAEEEAFEHTGRHAHPQREHGLQVLSAYEAPPKKQLSSLVRRLAKKSTLREAFLMKEVLDRPLGMRRRR